MNRMWKKHIANILSSIRILISLIQLFFQKLSGVFLALFCICGVTDLLDGPIARATGSKSALGAKLDTAGDVLTYTALAKILFCEKKITFKTLFRFVGPVFGMLVAGIIAKFKFYTFVFSHTALAKVFGGGCFFLPFSYYVGTDSWYLTALWMIALLTAVEMIVIQIFINHPDHDILFFARVKGSNERFIATLKSKTGQ